MAFSARLMPSRNSAASCSRPRSWGRGSPGLSSSGLAVTRREALKIGGAAGIGLLSAPGLTDELLSAPLEGQGGPVVSQVAVAKDQKRGE